MYSGCRVFPNDNPWNSTVDKAPVDTALMASVMPSMALTQGMHPDWGTATDIYGIPITVGKASTPVPITWNSSYGNGESDPLACPSGGGQFCYPIPLNVKIEGGAAAKTTSDRHVLFLATDGAPDHCVLYELYNTQNPIGGGFTAGERRDLEARLECAPHRRAGPPPMPPVSPSWPASSASNEIKRGEITHAIRFTMDSSQQAYIHPATHAAGDANPSLPPMGLRVRLKAASTTRRSPARRRSSRRR